MNRISFLSNLLRRKLHFHLVLALSILSIACTHTSQLRPPSLANELDQTNEELAGENAKIRLRHYAGELTVKNVFLSTDSVYYLDADTTHIEESIAISDVHKIVTKNHVKGAAEGFGIGILLGAGVFGGASLIALTHGDNSEGAAFARLGIVATGVAVGASTALISPIVGAVKGSKNVYILKKNE